MKKVDFKKLQKLSPDQRVKALREIQEELTKVIKDRSEEVSDSKDEIKDAQEFLKEAEDEMRIIEEMEIKAPKPKPVDVEKLFEREDKRTSARGPRERDIGEIAADAPKQPTQQEQQAYVQHLAQQESISNIYDRINAIRDDVGNRGVINSYQQDRLNQFDEALHRKEHYMREGSYKPGEDAEQLLTNAEKALRQTKDAYHRN